ncbi:MAG: zinc ribbon domain-containing protein [Caldiserica bacterium]|nr:zinc ribbon domain-containing protein [Caldisericota bacterium]
MPDFLDKFTKNVSKTIDTVKAKSGTMVESARIRNQIKVMEEEQTVRFQELGRMAHVLLQKEIQKDSLDAERIQDLREKSDTIKAKEDQIAQLNLQLQNLALKEASSIAGKRALGKCPGCGTMIYEADKFCGVCGLKVADMVWESAAPASSTQGEDFCPSCGHGNPQGSRFCLKCGTALTAPAREP